MSKRATFNVTVAGTNISTALLPILIGISVSAKVGKVADTASIEIDDKDAQIVLPSIGASVLISLGWAGEGVRQIFAGTVDEVHSSGGRGGRRLVVAAKGVDTTGKAKAAQRTHFDNSTVGQIIRTAGAAAGMTKFTIDPAIEAIGRAYFALADESFLSAAQRLAREVGAHFRIQGSEVIMAQDGGAYAPGVTAEFGVNLHTWDIAPAIGRQIFGTVRVRHYDPVGAKTVTTETSTGLRSYMAYAGKELVADATDATTSAGAKARASKTKAGSGSVIIEGNTAAVPDAICTVKGARPGIDGDYKITAVGHRFDRSAGFVTTLTLAQPHGAAGSDARSTTPVKSTSADYATPSSGPQ